ncbi:MAG: antitoxin [Methylibium sp. NZG]|nr:MAG: antitoxin [Methylibium sp. NZG]
MKTTLDINDQLLADAKALAAQQRTSLTRLIEEALQLRLRVHQERPRAKARLPVFKGRGGMVGGVDPLSNKAMQRALGDDA